MKAILFVFLTFFQNGLFAQKKGQDLMDSVRNALPSVKGDSNKMEALIILAHTSILVHPSDGIPYAQQGLAIAEKIKAKRRIGTLENALGLLIGDTGNNAQARIHFQRSFEINKELNISFNMISNLNNIGRSYQRESNFPHALEYFFKALTIAEETRNPEQIALVGTNLTSSYEAQGNLVKALEYAGITLKNAELSNTPANIGKALLNLGILQMEMKDTPSARIYLNGAMKVNEEMNNPLGQAQVLMSLAELEYPDYRKKIVMLLKAQQIIEEIGPNSLYGISNLANLGTAYYSFALQRPSLERRESLEKAESYTRLAIQRYKQTANAEYLSRTYLTLADIKEAKGDYKPALESFKSFYALNDSLFSQEKKNQLAGLENQHNIDLKDKEIAINKLELISQRKTLLGLVISLTLLGIIGGLLFWQTTTRKKTNTTLMVLNNQLDEANKIKVKFFGILSHDLRSPIGNLINFLYLLKNEPELLSASQKEKHQQQIGQSAEELLQTMETMLLWSKEQMENFRPNIKTVPVAELFDYLHKFFPATDGIRISYANPGALEVSTDENYLKVIMQNLTSNAIKALRNRPGAGFIEWKAAKEGERTILSITDNGPGMNAEQLKTLYKDEVDVNARTGFGLHLIRDLAKAIQYHISVESKPGLGTTFILSA
jgi:signal transduction histidine kinase